METVKMESSLEMSFSLDGIATCTVEESQLESAGGCVRAVSNANDHQIAMLDLVCNFATDGGVGNSGGAEGNGGGGGGGGEGGEGGGSGDVGVGGGGGSSEDGSGSGGSRSGGGVGKGAHGSGEGGGGTGYVGDSGVADEISGGEGVGGGGSGEHGSGSGGGRSGGSVGIVRSGPSGGDGGGTASDGDKRYGGDSGVAGENENINEEEEDDDVEADGDSDDDDKNDDEDDCKVKGKDEDKDDLDDGHCILLCESSSGLTSFEESSGSTDSFSSGQCDTGGSSLEINFPVPCSSAQLNAAAVGNGTPSDTGRFSDDDCRRWRTCKMCQSRAWRVVFIPCADLSCNPCREKLTDMICTLCGKRVEDIVTVKLAHEM